MPITEPHDALIGQWSPYTQIGAYVRTRFGWYCIAGVLLTVLGFTLAELRVVATPFAMLLFFPGYGVSSVKDRLIQRAVFRSIKAMGKGLGVYLRFISRDNKPREDTGILWFEGRQIHFKGISCEFNFDVTRFHFYDHFVDGVPTPYKLSAVDVGGKELAIVFAGTVGDNLIGDFGKQIEEALKQEPAAEPFEILPPISEDGYNWLPPHTWFIALCLALAAMLISTSIWMRVQDLTSSFYGGGCFGALAFIILSILAARDRIRYRRARERSG